MLTPNDLNILLHYYVSPVRHSRWDAPAVQESIKRFKQDGVFTEHEIPTVTDKGEAWIKDILSTPQPKQAWINSKGEII